MCGAVAVAHVPSNGAATSNPPHPHRITTSLPFSRPLTLKRIPETLKPALSQDPQAFQKLVAIPNTYSSLPGSDTGR